MATVGTVMATSAGSLEIESWRRQSSNFAYCRLYELTVFFIYWIAKCHACKKQESKETAGHSGASHVDSVFCGPK
jgi:hypothetical protein